MEWKEKDQGFKCYMALNTPVGEGSTKFKELKIEVCYTKGGINYFSGSVNPRGYKLMLTPCEHSGGMESFILMGDNAGKFVLIEEVQRFNKRRLIEHKDRLTPFIDEILKAFESKDITRLIAIAKGERVPEMVGA